MLLTLSNAGAGQFARRISVTAVPWQDADGYLLRLGRSGAKGPFL